MKFRISVFFLLSLTTNCDSLTPEFEQNATGMLDRIIIQILESFRPHLANVHLKCEHFETGPQEFGNFKGNVRDVALEGLDQFNVKVINTSSLDLNNLTLVQTFTATGFYHLNGDLVFPLGKTDIRLFGEGEFSAKFTNFTTSIKLKIRFENGTLTARDLDIIVGLDKIQAHFKNLMGGGDLEQVFNQLMNDVGLTVFDYYKEPILAVVTPQIKKIITDLLNRNIQNNTPKLAEQNPFLLNSQNPTSHIKTIKETNQQK